MSVIYSLVMTLLYIVYTLLYFIGAAFITIAFFEYSGKQEQKTVLSQLWIAILFISVCTVCYAGLGDMLSMFDVIEKIKDLW